MAPAGEGDGRRGEDAAACCLANQSTPPSQSCILAFAQEEPVAGVDDAGVPVAGAGAHLSIVGAQLSIAACGEQSRDS